MWKGKITIDEAGRVAIPKALRDEMQLEAVDKLELKSEGDLMILRTVRSRPALRKKQGAWVFSSGKRISAETTDRSREPTQRA